MCSERLREGFDSVMVKGMVKEMVKGKGTRPVYDAEQIVTGYGSKSRKYMVIPRKNGKSHMTAVKFFVETFGKKKASEIIAEVEKEMK